MTTTTQSKRTGLGPVARWSGLAAFAAAALFGASAATAAPPAANTQIGNYATASYLDPSGSIVTSTSNQVWTFVTQVGSFNVVFGPGSSATYSGAETLINVPASAFVTGQNVILVSLTDTSGGSAMWFRYVAPGTYWDGSATGSNSQVDGGTGTWATTGNNWTNSTGTVNNIWDNASSATAIFGGSSSTAVTVSNAGGAVNFGGITFNSNGYQLNTGTLTATGTTNALTVTTSGYAATINAILTGGSGNALTKGGAGNLTLGGANTFAGTMTVSTGTLFASNAAALGTTAGGTTVSSGAALGLQGGISIGAEPLTLSGTGIGAAGALNNVSGINTYGGPITLAAAASIGNASGSSLTLSNTINNAGFGLTFGADSAITASGIISGTGGVTKSGASTLTFSGANTFDGAISVNDGTLIVSNSAALGSTAGSTTVASNAALGLQGGISIGLEPLSVTGAGAGSGALYNISGDNTYGGAITTSGNTYTGASPSLSASYTLVDTTKVGNSSLDLFKEVRNVTTSGPWGASNEAKPGQTLEYRVTYKNLSAAPMAQVVIADTVPAYTTFVSATAGTVPSGLGNCTMHTPKNVEPAPAVSCTATQTPGGTGVIKWSFDGTLGSTATGFVSFTVLVD